MPHGKAKGEYLLTASVFSEKLLCNAISPDTSNQFTAKLITYLLFDFDLLSRNVLQGVPAESVGRMVSRSNIMIIASRNDKTKDKVQL